MTKIITTHLQHTFTCIQHVITLFPVANSILQTCFFLIQFKLLKSLFQEKSCSIFHKLFHYSLAVETYELSLDSKSSYCTLSSILFDNSLSLDSYAPQRFSHSTLLLFFQLRRMWFKTAATSRSIMPFPYSIKTSIITLFVLLNETMFIDRKINEGTLARNKALSQSSHNLVKSV